MAAALATGADQGPVTPAHVPKVCPLGTDLLVELVLKFVEAYNEPAKIHIYSYQRVFLGRIVESLLTGGGDVVTGLWSRQSGKSEVLASGAAALCIFLPTLAKAFPDDGRLTKFHEGFWVGVFAPRLQQSTIIYERIRTRAQRESSLEIYRDPDINVHVTTSRGDLVSWSNGSSVKAQTASDQSNVEGGTYHLVIIDEAQLVSGKKISKEIGPMLSSTNGTRVDIGTANALRGNFKDTIIQNINEEKKGGVRNHFEFPYDIVIAEKRRTYEKTGDPKHLEYERWVAGELKRLGGNKENEEFRQNFRLLWQEAHFGAIDAEAFAAAGDLNMEVVYSAFTGRIVGGLDFARKRDATILTIMWVNNEPIPDPRALHRPGGEQSVVFYEKKILAWYEIPGRKWQDILATVVEILGHYGIDTLVTDGTGVGDPVSEQLQNLVPEINVIPFVMSHVGNDKIYKLYIQELEAGRITYPSGEKAMHTLEFQSFVLEHNNLIKDKAGVYTKFYAPEGEHDDYCDSAALCCWAASLPPSEMGTVVAEENPFFARAAGSGSRGGRADRYR